MGCVSCRERLSVGDYEGLARGVSVRWVLSDVMAWRVSGYVLCEPSRNRDGSFVTVSDVDD